MEAIADDRLYLWHVFFGIAGCNNDITVLDSSPLAQMISEAKNPVPCEHKVSKVVRNKPYWLCNGIYPKYPCFLHSVLNPATREELYFAARQEERRKDVERAFVALQEKFHVLAVSCKLWSVSNKRKPMYYYVLLHNKVVDEKRSLIGMPSDGRTADVLCSENMDCCFERHDINRSRVVPGYIAAICAAERYLRSASENMN